MSTSGLTTGFNTWRFSGACQRVFIYTSPPSRTIFSPSTGALSAPPAIAMDSPMVYSGAAEKGEIEEVEKVCVCVVRSMWCVGGELEVWVVCARTTWAKVAKA